MAIAKLKTVRRDIDRLFREGNLSAASDARLLELFVTDRDEAAFEALTARHGPLVLGTCRDILGNSSDAEDAFQATFLILLRRSATIRRGDSLAGWLHRVACRVARHALASAGSRRACEGRVVPLAPGVIVGHDPVARDELRGVLHAEIERLPERNRKPVILCLLEGLTQAEAAQRLGWSEGSVRGRLTRGRRLLRMRLTRRGIAPAAVVAASLEAFGRPPAVLAQGFLDGGRSASAEVLARAVNASRSWTLVTACSQGAAVLLAACATLAVALCVQLPAAALSPPATPVSAPPTPQLNPAASLGAPRPHESPPPTPAELAARSIVFQGKVLDPNGRPIEGAKLHLIVDRWSKAEQLAVTARDGTFRFERTEDTFARYFLIGMSPIPLFRTVVLATADGFGTAWTTLESSLPNGRAEAEYNLSLRLVDDQPITGRIVDLLGRPVAGAQISVQDLCAPATGNLDAFVAFCRSLEVPPLHFNPAFEWLRPTQPGGPTVIAPVITDADGRFRLTGAGRERLLGLTVEGAGIANTSWNVLTRVEADEVTRTVRARWPRVPSRDGPPVAAGKTDAPVGRKGQEPAVLLFGPTVELAVDPSRTVSGIVRDARTGRPLPNASIWVRSDPNNGVAGRTDAQGRYHLQRTEKSDRIVVGVSDDWSGRGEDPPRTFLGAVKSIERASGLGNLEVDFGLLPGLVVTGKVLEAATGRPMLAYPRDNCGVPGKPLAGMIYYQPLAGNAKAREGEWAAYYGQIKDPKGLYVGEVADRGVLTAVVPPGPGVVLFTANPGLPMMATMGSPAFSDKDGYHRRFPYGRLSGRLPDDGLPTSASPDRQTLPGAFGPISLESFVAYRIINPVPDVNELTIEVRIPRALSRKLQFRDPEGRPVRGVIVRGLISGGFSQEVSVEGDEAEAMGLDPLRPREIIAVSVDQRYRARVKVRGDSSETLVVPMQPSSGLH